MSDVTEAPAERPAPAMSVTVERTSEVERKVDVEIPWSEVKDRLDEAYHELQQGVAIKGFRKGKVPRRMLEQLFGKHVVKEVAQRLVQESIAKALIDHEVAPVSEPRVEDTGITEGQSFRYSAVMQVVPPIEPRDYEGVEVKMRAPVVTETAIDLALQVKQQELTAFRAVEGRNTQAGDVLVVDVMGKRGQTPVDLSKQLVELGDPPREPLPGLAAALTNIASDTKELDLGLEMPVEGGGTEKAKLLVTILEVRQKVVPELDDDFAKDTGEAETLAALREVLRRKLEEEDRKRAEQEARDQLLDAVVAKNEIPLIPALVDRTLTRRLALQKALLGLDPDAPSGADEEALKEGMRTDAAASVQRALMLGAIAKKEKVEVLEADLEKKLAEVAAARGQNLARVKSEYEKDGLMNVLRERILEEKTLDLLMSRANIKVEEAAPSAVSPGTDAAAAPVEPPVG